MKTKTQANCHHACTIALSLLVSLPAYAFRSDASGKMEARLGQTKAKAAAIRAPDAEQLEAAQLAEKSGIQVEWHSSLGTPLSIRGPDLGQRRPYSGGKGLLPQGGGLYEKDAIAVMNNLARFYGLKDAETEFTVKQAQRDSLNFHHVRLTQVYQGLRVFGGDLTVHFDKNGQAYQVNGQYVPDIQVGVFPKVEAKEAVRRAQRELAAMGKPEATLKEGPTLVVFARDAEPRLAYEFILSYEDPKAGPGRWRYWVDALDGGMLLRYNDVKKIAPPTANGTNAVITGSILVGEGGQSLSVTGRYENTGFFYLYNTNRFWYVYNVATSGHLDADTYAYRTTGNWGTSDRAEMSLARNFDVVQRYYREVHGRDSFDDAGLYARANAHEGASYVNAYWDGTDFHFGDGDGAEANSLAVLDVCAHEFTHAVTEYTANLTYQGESGALNESFSDVMGTCVEFYAQPDGQALYPNRSAGTADWLCGEDCWLSSTALRDLRNPANTATVGAGNEQPSRYQGAYWYSGSGDNGGVHQNSGVQNFFFYLLCQGGSGDNDGIIYHVTGIGVTNAQRVAYRALTVYCTPNTDYRAVRSAWISAALDLNPSWAESAGAAWSAVGINALIVTPSRGLTFRGPVGGPFSPATQAFVLANRGVGTMHWGLGHTQAWVNVAPTSGTIAAGGSNLVNVSINAAANALPMAVHWDGLIFSNDVDTVLQTYAVRLLVGQPDYFTELFDAGDNDLSYQTITFTPDGSSSFYSACREIATSFPTDPSGGATVSLGDDDYAQVTLSGTDTVAIYSRRTNVFFIGSNGYLTMDSGDSTYTESLASHFNRPRVSACFDDLYPGGGGTVSWQQTSDLVAVTFADVQEYGSSATVNFQIEMFYDGRIRITYLGIGITDGLAGLSAGQGVPADFEESDLSGYGICRPPDDLVVTPYPGLASQGFEGGPFLPDSAAYLLSNAGTNALNWSAAVTQPWVTADLTGGSLAPGASTNVTILINNQADALAPGFYTDTCNFRNLGTGFTQSRSVSLLVKPIPGNILVVDSIAPTNDLEMPFGEVLMSRSRTERLTVINTNASHSLLISNIWLVGGAYVEDFNDGLAQGWVPLVPAYWQVVAGEYRAQAGTTDVRMQSLYFGQVWQDCSAQVQMRCAGQMSSASRILLRATDDFSGPSSHGSAYVVAISGDGSYYVGKYVSGTFTFIQEWTASPYLNPGAATNTVLVNLQGSALGVFFNGNLAWSGSDATIVAAGRLGLLPYSGADFETVHYYDNVIVSSPLPLRGTVGPLQQFCNKHPLAGGSAEAAPLSLPSPAVPAYAGGREFRPGADAPLLDLSATNGPWRLENLPAFPYSLAPGAALALEVTYAPNTTASNDLQVVIESNDADEPRVEVRLTGHGIPDYLQLAPDTDLVSQGYKGGPFAPSSATYSLSNAGTNSLNWSAAATQPWVTVTPAGGSLVAGASADVTLLINTNAQALSNGVYGAAVAFSNLVSGAVQTRGVQLTVLPNTLHLAAAAYSVWDTNGQIVIPVVREGVSASRVTVTFSTSDGTAVAGVDYVATNGILTLPDGVTNASLSVVIIAHPERHPPATFAMELFNATGGVILTNPSTAEVTILNDHGLIWAEYLDTDPGWATEEQWAFGVPLGGGSHCLDPTSGNTGANVYGYNLAGDYPNSMSQAFLTTPAINCAGYEHIELRFWRWLGVESSSYDHACVQASPDGITWTTLWDHAGSSFCDGAWRVMVYTNLAAVADNQPTVYLRWGMGPTDGSVTYPGWNIDDIVLMGDRMDSLVIQPVDGWISTGYEGGPFEPSTMTYTLRNAGANPLSWAVAATQPWVTVPAAGGSLSAGATAGGTLRINTNAQALGQGVYVASVLFSNLTSGVVQTRAIQLTVEPRPLPPPQPFNPDPTNGARVVSIHTRLSWNNIARARPQDYSDMTGRMDLTTARMWAPHTHNVLRPRTKSPSGGAVLWDLTHGVYLTYEPSGAFSSMVSLLTSRGFSVDTIATGLTSASLAPYNVLVICLGSAWDSAYSPAEVAVIQDFVAGGGGLVIMGENTACPNANINPIATVFGITCGISDLSPDDLYFSNFAAHAVFNGCSQLYYRAAGELAASPPGTMIAWTDGGQGTIAACVNNGRVLITGDTGPYYNDSITTADNQRFVENVFDWVSQGSGGPGVVYYNVYLGSGPTAMTLIANNVTERTCDPGPLAFNHTYYWQVVASDVVSSVTGAVWTFTTSLDEVHFASATYSVAENGGAALVTVVRENPAGGAVSVHYATADGTATAGSDYTPASGTLLLPAGVLGTNFQVAILDDSVIEGDETVLLLLSQPPANVLLGAPADAVLTIIDNDGPPDFQISGLFTNNSRVVDHELVTGDDRGGIAVSASQVFVTGDSSTARFNAADLSGGISLGRMVDGLCTDLQTETVYSLGNGATPLTAAGGTVTTLIELDGATGQPSGVLRPLSQSFTMPSWGNGIFSGYGRVVVFNGTHVYDIFLPSGTVTDQGAMTQPNWESSESWSVWGVAEFFGGSLYLAYARSGAPVNTIERSRVPDGAVTSVAVFSDLSDMASFTVSLSRNRWYFHHEYGGQFGGTAETLGYADASFISSGPPRIVAGGSALLAEGCHPPNGVIDPGETVTVSFGLQNLGGTAASNVVARLLATGGVVSPSGPQSYGQLPPGGPMVSSAFVFTAAGACGGTLLAVLQVQDGTNHLGSVTNSFRLGVPTAVLAENFDGVTAPNLPAGWTASLTGAGTPWATSTTYSDTPPNAVFAPDPSSTSDNWLTSPAFLMPANGGLLSFRHAYSTESCCDGGWLEISIAGGAFTDILAAGGGFVTNGYPAGSRWHGTSAGFPSFITTIASLPPSALGQNIQLRWRFTSDYSVSAPGWYMDTVYVDGGYDCCTPGLVIQPDDGLVSLGYQGGPFSPANKVYTLQNTSASDLNWAASCAEPWVTITPAGGNLAPGAATNAMVQINPNAQALNDGGHTASVLLSNLLSGVVQTRPVQLTVEPRPLPPPEPFNPIPTNGARVVSVHTLLSWNGGALTPKVINPAGLNLPRAVRSVPPASAGERVKRLSFMRDGVAAAEGVWIEESPPTAPAADTLQQEPGHTLINFDDLIAPCNFAQTVRLTDRYAAAGVVFAGPGGNDGAAILDQCGNFGLSGFSWPNFLAFNTSSALSDGGVPRAPETLYFNPPVSQVSMLVGSRDSAGQTLTLQAFDSVDFLVSSTNVTLASVMSPLTVAGAGITRAVVSCAGSVFVIDDLSFVSGLAPVTGYDVYLGREPASLTRIASNLTETTCDPGPLAFNTTYYWQVVAFNAVGSVTGAVWTFTTALDEVHFASATYSVAENGGAALITVTRENPAANAVSVDYATADGTATAGSDYTPASGTLLLPAGVLSTNFQVAILDDNVMEGDETVLLLLSQPSPNVLLSSPSNAVLTIVDDETQTVAYFTDNNSASTGPEAPITLAGYLPVQVNDIASLNLNDFNTLFLDEYDNNAVSAALQGRLAGLQDWVNNGGKLIIHDRSAGNLSPNPFLLGAGATPTLRLETADLDVIPPGTNLVVAGPFGTIDNATLDGGDSSAHGYVPANQLPPGAAPILSVGGDASEVVCFSYPLGNGFVYYSGIPLDCYLAGGDCTGIAIAAPLQNVYTPNVLRYVASLGACSQCPPTITSQPANQTVSAGSTVLFTVGAAGSGRLTYQWRSSCSLPANATNALLTLPEVTTSQSGCTYWVEVTNPYGSVTSSVATLTIVAEGADLITFDDLSGDGVPVPDGYHALTWNNFSYEPGAPAGGGYVPAVISSPNVAYNADGNPASLVMSRPFNLLSGYFTAAWNDDLQLEVLGYAGSSITYSNLYTLSATTPTPISFAYLGVTTVGFRSFGGTPHPGYGGSGTHFAMDNLLVMTTGGLDHTFVSSDPITIPDSGAATPYPSTITVAGLVGAVTKVSVTLSNMNHTYADDIDVLLVGPTGSNVILMANAGGSHGLGGVTLTLDDLAAVPLPDSDPISSGVYRPAAYATANLNWPAPAPAGPWGSALSDFNGADPNGVWSLFVYDDAGGDSGIIQNGWSLTISTAPQPQPVVLPPVLVSGQIELRFPTQAGQHYTLQFKESLDDPSWQDLVPAIGDGTIQTVRDPVSGVRSRFYRLHVP